jgi:predicted kinase
MENNHKLLYLKGLPASGKSFLSRQKLSQDRNLLRVNKDEIRELLEIKKEDLTKIFDEVILHRMVFMDRKPDQGTENFISRLKDRLVKSFTSSCKPLFKAQNAKSFGPKEKWVIQIQSCIIKFFVENQKNIIVDDTNYNTEHLTRIRDLCKGYDFEIIDMHKDFGVTIEECIKRNKNRVKSVPEVAIYGMAKRYGVCQKNDSNAKKQEPFSCYRKYIVSDADGTICNCDHRLHFIQGEGKKDWNSFFAGIENDTVNEVVKQLIDLTYPDYPVVIVTGRPEKYREVTEKWLKKNNIRHDAIYMRKDNDRRPDTIIKQEIIDLYLDKSKIEIWVDDRGEIIKLLRNNKIKVIDVGNGKEF